MAAHFLMGRSDVDPEFMPFAPVTFDDPLASGEIDREGAPTIEPVDVCVYRDVDGAIVVKVDYDPLDTELARVRVVLDDATIYDENIDTGESFPTT